jgi:hypothetical protein
VNLNDVQRCQSIVTAVANKCAPMTSPMCGRRIRSPSRDQQPRISHHRTDADPCIVE